jgi:HSP20 family protein
MSKKDINTNNTNESLPILSKAGLLSFDDFDHFFNDFLSNRWPRLLDWNTPNLSPTVFPRVDVIDHDQNIEVHAALPGVKKEDVSVAIHHQSITISTSSKEEKTEEEPGKYFRREISHGQFQRTLSLPENIDEDQAKASFKDGILTVTIPKTEKSKSKNLEIQ